MRLLNKPFDHILDSLLWTFFYSVFKCEIIVINDISILKKILINELFTEMLNKFMILSTSVLGKALQK